jgi:predicted transcriptional regulator
MKLQLAIIEHFLLTAGHRWTADECALVVAGKKSAVYRALQNLTKKNFIIHDRGATMYKLHPRFIEPILSYEKTLKKELQWKKEKTK